MKSMRGFTLIELLVVVAIIGILAGVIMTALGPARAKSRDAKRMSEMKQMANVISIMGEQIPIALVGCTAAGSRVSTCTSPDLTRFRDISGVTTACTATATADCDYVIGTKSPVLGANPGTENWMICARLETNTGPLGNTTTGGMVQIGQEGSVKAGCN